MAGYIRMEEEEEDVTTESVVKGFEETDVTSSESLKTFETRRTESTVAEQPKTRSRSPWYGLLAAIFGDGEDLDKLGLVCLIISYFHDLCY